MCFLKEDPNRACPEGSFFFGFFPSPSATHAILAESTSWKELGSDMYDMELQRELAVFLMRLFWAEGWNDDMLGAWIRETFHASSWENERSSWRGQQMEDFGFQLGSLEQFGL